MELELNETGGKKQRRKKKPWGKEQQQQKNLHGYDGQATEGKKLTHDMKQEQADNQVTFSHRHVN